MRAVLLDAHGTLVELEPPAPALRALLDSQFGVEVSEGEAAVAIAAEIAYYRARLNEGRDSAGLASLRARCAEAMRDALPAAAGERLGTAGPQELTTVLLRSLRFRLFDDVLEALGAMRGAGLRLVVASNWDVSLSELLAALGAGALLDGVVTSAQVGASKPAGAVFAEALALAGVGAGEAVHVGDRMDEDVAGAAASGIEPILLRRDGSPGPGGVGTIASLRELLALISVRR